MEGRRGERSDAEPEVEVFCCCFYRKREQRPSPKWQYHDSRRPTAVQSVPPKSNGQAVTRASHRCSVDNDRNRLNPYNIDFTSQSCPIARVNLSDASMINYVSSDNSSLTGFAMEVSVNNKVSSRGVGEKQEGPVSTDEDGMELIMLSSSSTC